MSVFPPHSRDIRLATMGAGFAMMALAFANGQAGADDSIWPAPPAPTIDPTLTVPAAVAPITGMPATTMPAATMPTVTMPTTTMPGATMPTTPQPANGALLPTLLVNTGTFLGQLGTALGASTPATVPGS